MKEWPVDRLLNSRVPHTSMVRTSPLTLTIFRQKVQHLLPEAEYGNLLARFTNISALANHLISSRRINVDPRVLLHIYVVLKSAFSTKCAMLNYFQSAMLSRLRPIRLWLPKSLTLRIVHMTSQEQSAIKKVCLQFFQQLQVHEDIFKYYSGVLRVVRVAPSKFRHKLFNYKRVLSSITWAAMKAMSDSLEHNMCPCSNFPELIDPRLGHILFRPSDLPCVDLSLCGNCANSDPPCSCKGVLTAVMIQGLQQHAGADVWQSLPFRRAHLYSQLQAMCSKLYGTTHLRRGLCQEAFDCLKSIPTSVLHRKLVKGIQAAQRLLSCCCIGPLDKNPNSSWICCKNYYVATIYRQFFSASSIGGFKMITSPQHATVYMKEQIVKYHLTSHAAKYKLRSLHDIDLSAVPYLYVLFKNKMFPLQQTGLSTPKVRPITAHATHPLSQWSTRCGRGLSVLIRTLTSTPISDSTIHCHTMMKATEFWKTVVSETCDTSATMDTVLFEYDLDNMFYHIDQSQCLSYVQQFMTIITQTLRRRTVAINKSDSKMDRIGSGSAEFYFNISVQDLFNQCQYELLGNTVAHIGFLCFQQSIGVPMGGHLSSQLASIYLIMREYLYHLPTKLPPSVRAGRYMDNIFGAFSANAATLDEIRKVLWEVYDMPLKLEQAGIKLDTLEMRVMSLPSGISFQLKPLMYDVLNMPIDHSIMRIPPLHSPSRTHFLPIYVPAILLKCVRYASSVDMFFIGARNMILGLLQSGFSLSQLRTLCLRTFVRHYESFQHYASFSQFNCNVFSWKEIMSWTAVGQK